MRFPRGLFAFITFIVICILCIVTLAEGRNSGTEEAQELTGDSQHWSFILPVLYIAMAVGVITLGLYCKKLSSQITSMAGLISDERSCISGFFVNLLMPLRIKRINEALKILRERIVNYKTCVQEYENQIKELQIQIQLSQKREKNTEAIIYSIRDAVLVTDESDNLLIANEATEKLFDFDFKSSYHKPVSEIIGKEYKEFLDFLDHSVKRKSQALKHEITFVKDGIPKTFDCIFSCVYDQNQQVCGTVVVLHNVTREKEVSKMKDDFVSHVSHELKTPLASITAYSEMLADGEAVDEQTRREFYSVIQNQAQRLNRLIEDILNTSRIESGLVKINKELVSLTILIEEQLQMIQNYAEEKNVEVTSQRPIVFDQVFVDRDMISQVIVNLLSNAVKYTRPGGTVKIETQVDENAKVVRATVTDTGVGIPEDEIEHVFDKYYRVGANKKEAKGTGLGLNLVKQIIEKVHNGRVFVSSRVGQGSTFGFELPIATQIPAGAA